jgi:sugar (pentulose or hexulose) kinase
MAYKLGAWQADVVALHLLRSVVRFRVRCARAHSLCTRCRARAGHDAEMRAFRLQFRASAAQLAANVQHNLNIQARAHARTHIRKYLTLSHALIDPKY